MRFYDCTSAINSATKFVVFIALLSLLFRRRVAAAAELQIQTAHTSTTGSSAGDPEEAKRQAQSLVDKGKELYKNDQDEQAVEAFKQAIQSAILITLKRTCVWEWSTPRSIKRRKPTTNTRRQSNFLRRETQSDSKDADAFFLFGRSAYLSASG